MQYINRKILDNMNKLNCINRNRGHHLQPIAAGTFIQRLNGAEEGGGWRTEDQEDADSLAVPTDMFQPSSRAETNAVMGSIGDVRPH